MEVLIYGSIAFLALLGTPIFIIMALLALVAFSFAQIDISAVSISMYQIASQPMLITFPLFTFAGFLIAESNSPARMFRLSQALLGWLPGGVAVVSLIVCAFFTAFTGASGVTIIALGGILYPILRSERYSDQFTLGLITTCGSLGLLFPPSLPIILYGLVAKVDIESIFKAGILPGCLLIVLLALYALKSGRKLAKDEQKTNEVEAAPDGTTYGVPLASHAPTHYHFSPKEMVKAIKGCFWEILLPIGVLVGIYGGYATTSETAALTAGYCLLMECFIYKEIRIFKDVPGIIQKSLALVGAILLILCCALGLTDYLVDEEIPMKLLAFMQHYISSKLAFLLFLNIFLLVVGCMMDIFSAIIVVVPLIVPIAKEYGVDPVHLAIVFLTNLEIGYIHPPVGINIFLCSFRFKRPVTQIYRATIPFLVLMVAALLIITYVPWLSLVLVK